MPNYNAQGGEWVSADSWEEAESLVAQLKAAGIEAGRSRDSGPSGQSFEPGLEYWWNSFDELDTAQKILNPGTSTVIKKQAGMRKADGVQPYSILLSTTDPAQKARIVERLQNEGYSWEDLVKVATGDGDDVMEEYGDFGLHELEGVLQEIENEIEFWADDHPNGPTASRKASKVANRQAADVDMGDEKDLYTTEGMPETGHSDAIDDDQVIVPFTGTANKTASLEVVASLVEVTKGIKDRALRRRLATVTREYASARGVLAEAGIKDGKVPNFEEVFSTKSLESPDGDDSAIDDSQKPGTLQVFTSKPPEKDMTGPNSSTKTSHTTASAEPPKKTPVKASVKATKEEPKSESAWAPFRKALRTASAKTGRTAIGSYEVQTDNLGSTVVANVQTRTEDGAPFLSNQVSFTLLGLSKDRRMASIEISDAESNRTRQVRVATDKLVPYARAWGNKLVEQAQAMLSE
jgi:hypothetical protein